MKLFSAKLTRVNGPMYALTELQNILYLTKDELGKGGILDPDKEHDSDTLERINDLAMRYGLRPATKTPIR